MRTSAWLIMAFIAFVIPGIGTAETPTPTIVQSNQGIVDALHQAYETLDLDLFQSLFVREGEQGVPYTFFLASVSGDTRESWGLAQELRIHQRMFRPQDTPADDKPVPPALWLDGIQLELERHPGGFRERYDLYRSDAQLEGLSDKRWRAMSASYNYLLQLHTRGGQEIAARGIATFVVIEDLALRDTGKQRFFLYQWHDQKLPVGSLARADAGDR